MADQFAWSPQIRAAVRRAGAPSSVVRRSESDERRPRAWGGGRDGLARRAVVHRRHSAPRLRETREDRRREPGGSHAASPSSIQRSLELIRSAHASNPTVGGSDQRILGGSSATRISCCARARSMSDPAAAEDASHAVDRSPDTTARRRPSVAFSANRQATMSSSCVDWSCSGAAIFMQAVGSAAQPARKRLEMGRRRSGKPADLVQGRLRFDQPNQQGAH